MADSVILKVGGQRFEGWTMVTIERGLDSLCGAFTLALTERFPGQPERWAIETGDAFELLIDGDLVFTGWIDRAAYRLGGEDHPVEISGREKTGDLVDCSAIHQPGSWSNRTALQIAQDLVQPFGLSASADVEVGAPFASFALQQGEAVVEALERLGRQRGLLLTTDAAGNLLLTRPGSASGGFALEEGVNLEEIEFVNDGVERFSAYRLVGHDGSDESAGSAAARPSAEATDEGVRRHRPLLIVNDEESTAATLLERARWEATVRAARAQTIMAVVSSWRSAGGALYRPNVLVPVRAPTVGIEAELLVASVSFTRAAEEGTRTTLMLARPEAFSLEPLAAPETARRTAAVPPEGR